MGEGIVAKIIGVLCGVVLSLVFDAPRSRAGFIRRTIVAIVGGYVFGHLVLHFMDWQPDTENIVAAWCISSASSWYVMGRARQLIRTYSKEKDG